MSDPDRLPICRLRLPPSLSARFPGRDVLVEYQRSTERVLYSFPSDGMTDDDLEVMRRWIEERLPRDFDPETRVWTNYQGGERN
jgi:hypothetical protein